MKHNLESRLPGEMSINNLKYADDTTLMAENEEELKSFLMKVKEESEKVGLKLNIQASWSKCPGLRRPTEPSPCRGLRRQVRVVVDLEGPGLGRLELRPRYC